MLTLLLVLEIIHNMLNNLYVLARKSSDILENPIRTFSDFAELLDMGLKNRQVGDIDVLKNLLPPTRRLIQEDKGKFETELCEKIKSGEYLNRFRCKSCLNIGHAVIS